MTRCRAALGHVLPLILAFPGLLASQAVEASVQGSSRNDLSFEVGLGYQMPRLGPATVSLGGLYLSSDVGDRWGAGVNVAFRMSEAIRVYPVAGVAAGWGSGNVPDSWGSWSAGLGWRLMDSRFGAAIEVRYVDLSSPGDGVMAGVRLRFGAGAIGPAPRPAPPPMPGFRSAFAAGVTQAALDVMGTPYVWGGSSDNGFDCSGLIQYAFREMGVALPRTSREQATVGAPVAADPGALAAGDILVFGDRPGSVTHVGLYLGDGRFIHSASAGVRTSLLDPNDPDGAYWWRRWLGARRVSAPY